MSKKIVEVFVAIGSIATLLQWIETSQWLPFWIRAMLDMLSPYLGKIVSTSALVLAYIALCRIARIDKRLRVIEATPTTPVATATPLSEDELLSLDMLWQWDRNRHEVIGPLCPDHKTALAYQPSVGLPPIYADFEDKWLGASGWLFCPRDTKKFPTATGGKIEDIRWDIDNRFRTIFNIPAKPKRPPTPEELELQRKMSEKLFGPK